MVTPTPAKLIPTFMLVGTLTLLGCAAEQPDGTAEDQQAGETPAVDGGAEPVPDASLPSDGEEAPMVVVPAGTFIAGCDLCHPARDGEECTTCDPNLDDRCGLCQMDEQPVHEVELSEYEIDVTVVTQRAYAECVEAGECTAPRDNFDPVERGDYPVVSVTWDQADTYCEFRDKRLPTEAEWEKAARGEDGRLFPWGDDFGDCSLANTHTCERDVLPVGSLPAGASPYRALDMAGNVWEWTADYYSEDIYEERDGAKDPTGPETGERRVYRGGSSGNYIDLARASNRADSYNPDFGGSGLGFRCARSR